MKQLLLIAMTLVLGYQAQAAVTSTEFTSEFIEQINHRLQVTNKERAAAEKATYCTALTKKQEQLIADTIKANPEITVAEFTDKVANSLKCYPEFWSPWGRTKNVRGMLVNTKAYVMDILLIRDVLEDLNDGASVADNSKVLDSYSHFGY